MHENEQYTYINKQKIDKNNYKEITAALEYLRKEAIILNLIQPKEKIYYGWRGGIIVEDD
jgi:hypothetical protein